jgi:hypothetical protein
MNRRVASSCEAAPPQVRALWTDLLARLWLAQVVCAQEHTLRQLHALGLRRTGTAGAILTREALLACRMASSFGILIRPAELQWRIGELARPAPLASHLQGLVEAYRRIELEPCSPMHGSLVLWLAGRQRVHQAQLAAVDPGGARADARRVCREPRGAA